MMFADRFWAKVKKLPNGCWEWTGATNGKYGQIKIDGKNVVAHRVAYFLKHGHWPRPWPEFNLDHLCRNKLCVNPEHTEDVTFRTNILRGTQPSAANAAKLVCDSGHSLGADGDVYLNGKGHRTCRICRREQDARRRDKRSRRAYLVAWRAKQVMQAQQA